MNRILVGLQVIQNVILQGPFKEIKLAHRGIQPLEVNVLPTTEGVEHTLGLCLEMRLLRKIHNHLTSIRGILGNILLLCLIRDKPIQKTKRNTRFTGQDHADTFEVCGVGLKALQTVKDPLLLGLNCLHCISCSLRRENGFSFLPTIKGTYGRVPALSSRQSVDGHPYSQADEEIRTSRSSYGIYLEQNLSAAGSGMEHRGKQILGAGS